MRLPLKIQTAFAYFTNSFIFDIMQDRFPISEIAIVEEWEQPTLPETKEDQVLEDGTNLLKAKYKTDIYII